MAFASLAIRWPHSTIGMECACKDARRWGTVGLRTIPMPEHCGATVFCMVIICGISSWEYHCTPPMLRDLALDPVRVAAQMPRELRGRMRSNAREADLLVRDRLCGELKGLTLPVHVYVDHYGDPRTSRITMPHVLPERLGRSSLIDLGGGLYVLTPEATMALQCPRLGRYGLAKMLFQACGIFSIAPRGRALGLAISELVSSGVLTRDAFSRQGVYGYSDARGVPLGDYDLNGSMREWVPSFDRRGGLTDLWKHPPMTSVQSVAREFESLGFLSRRSWRWQALRMVANGSASPVEARAYLMLCSGAWNGGESWGAPDLNREIVFTSEAAALAHSTHCYADMLWRDKRSVLEVHGEGFHADEQGFRIATGRTPALESMGYAVGEITDGQMRDLEVFDTLVETLARKLDMPLQPRTPAFLKRRGALHRALFGVPYKP